MATVADIMSRQVVVVTAETPVTEVARLMVAHDISGLPVMDGDRLVGLITELDMIARRSEPDVPSLFPFFGGYLTFGEHQYEEEVRRILATTAGEIMTTTVYSIREDATVEDVAELMYEREVNPVPVLNAQRRLVGIVSRSDLIRLMVREESQ
jgi:CBS domain-containing protein